MAKGKKPRTPKPAGEPRARSYVWRWPGTADPYVASPILHTEPKPPRGGLDRTEEMEIASTPRPMKPHGDAKDEHDKRAALADTVRRRDDHIPYKLHDAHRVDARGAPEFAAQFFAILTGKCDRTPAAERMELVYAELGRVDPNAQLAVREYYLYGRTQADIAAAVEAAQSTVSEALRRGLAWMNERYAQLYGSPSREASNDAHTE